MQDLHGIFIKEKQQCRLKKLPKIQTQTGFDFIAILKMESLWLISMSLPGQKLCAIEDNNANFFVIQPT